MKQFLWRNVYASTVFFVWGAVAWGSTPEPLVEVQDSDYHVVVNIPQTRLFLYKDGQFVRDYPVVVGKRSTRTPPGEYRVGTVAFNPTWHIPQSIRREIARRSGGKAPRDHSTRTQKPLRQSVYSLWPTQTVTWHSWYQRTRENSWLSQPWLCSYAQQKRSSFG